MRSGRDFVNYWLERRQYPTTESRDAIITSIDQTNRKVKVRIQGCTQDITCNYPENFEQTPNYLRIGNAVRLTYKAGNRLALEISGHGLALPTQISTPAAMPPPPDRIMDGLYLTQVPNSPCMKVLVEVGTVRFQGVSYEIDPISMGNGDFYVMGMGGNIGVVAGIIDCSTPTLPGVGKFRYDAITVDNSLNLGRTIGVSDALAPLYPATDGLVVGYILMSHDMTKVQDTDINAALDTPNPTTLITSLATTSMTFANTQTYIDVSVVDQHNRPIYTTGAGWPIQASLSIGNGFLGINSATLVNTMVLGYTGANSCGARFWYKRKGSLEVSPTIQFSLEVNFIIKSYASIVLYDSDGLPIS